MTQFMGIAQREADLPYRIIGLMTRTDLHLKIELEHGEDDPPEKLAADICRMVLNVYGVVAAEVSSIMPSE
jgi:hypothetical protein